MTTFFARHHLTECAMVLSLLVALSGLRGDNARAWCVCGAFDDSQPFVELRAGSEQADSTAFESDQRFVAGRRNLCPGQRGMEVSVSSGGFSRQHARFSAEWEAGWQDWVNRTQEWTINTCALGCSGWHLSVLSSKKAGLFQLENIEGKHHESD